MANVFVDKPIRMRIYLAFTVGMALLLVFLLLSLVDAQAQSAPTAEEAPISGKGATIPASFPNGVASGDVSQHTAVLWARSTATGPITFTYGTSLVTGTTVMTKTVTDPWVPAKVQLTNLTPGTEYQYRVTTAVGESANGRFRTNAEAGQKVGLRFGAGGDWDGRLAPFPALSNADERNLDFFLSLGDTVFVDAESPALMLELPTTMEEMRIKYSEIFSGRLGINTLADLRASTSILATIDDHEVINDFAGGIDASLDDNFPETSGFVNDTELYERGLQGFIEYQPVNEERYGLVDGDGRMDFEYKLYRYRTYGDDAAVFVLDLRSFRDSYAPSLPLPVDQISNTVFLNDIFVEGRTLMGKEQLRQLKADLLDAEQKGITWKFIGNSMVMQNIGQGGESQRGEGYGEERADLLNYIEEQGISNVVFLAADLHSLIVNNLVYQTGADQPVLQSSAFEIINGGGGVTDPFAPVIMRLGGLLGFVTEEEATLYNSVPISIDGDTELDDKDDVFRNVFDQRIAVSNFDPIGLNDSPINAKLIQGDYVAAHTFNWSEYEIDAETQVLTVTVYGTTPYSQDDVTNNPADVQSRTPEIVSQFVVTPTDSSATVYLPMITAGNGAGTSGTIAE